MFTTELGSTMGLGTVKYLWHGGIRGPRSFAIWNHKHIGVASIWVSLCQTNARLRSNLRRMFRLCPEFRWCTNDIV